MLSSQANQCNQELTESNLRLMRLERGVKPIDTDFERLKNTYTNLLNQLKILKNIS